MKFKFLLLFFAFILAAPVAQASFPVKRVVQETVAQDSETVTDVLYSPAAEGQKSQGVALILAIFLGFLAGHRWYLGSPWYWNLLYIVTFQGALVWLVIDIIDIVSGKYPAKGGFKSDFW